MSCGVIFSFFRGRHRLSPSASSSSSSPDLELLENRLKQEDEQKEMRITPKHPSHSPPERDFAPESPDLPAFLEDEEDEIVQEAREFRETLEREMPLPHLVSSSPKDFSPKVTSSRLEDTIRKVQQQMAEGTDSMLFELRQREEKERKVRKEEERKKKHRKVSE